MPTLKGHEVFTASPAAHPFTKVFEAQEPDTWQGFMIFKNITTDHFGT